MDVNNEHLKVLLDQTDRAFKALLDNPDSSELNNEYEQARRELNDYMVTLRRKLAVR